MVDKTLIEVKKISNKKMKNGKTLKELLAYGKVSLWWFIEPALYLQIKRAKNRRIAGKELFMDLICIFVKIFIVAKSLFRGFFGRLTNSGSNISNHQKIITSSSLWYWRDIIDSDSLKIKKGDEMFSGIINTLKKYDFEVIGLDRDDTHTIEIGRFLSKLIHGKKIWKPIETYLDFNIIMKAFAATKKMESNWNEFLKHIETKDKKLFKYLSDDFRVFFVYHIFQAVLFIELTKKIIEVENPKLVLVSSELADTGRAMVIASKLKKIPVLTIQHGYFSTTSFRDYHSTREVSNEISPQHYPFQDKMAVYGPRFKKFLVDLYNYPSKTIVVTGQPRYDILTKSDEIFSRERFCKNHNLSLNKKIVLVTTHLYELGDGETFLRNTLRSLNKFTDVEIVIKPHPRENESQYKKIMQEERVNATVLPRTYNTYEALHACDVMMTVASTTIIEAIILGKIVIVVNLINDPNSAYYIKSRAVLGVYRAEDLTRTIEKALYDKRTAGKLKKSIKGFVYQYAYKQDGKATERVVNLIKKMIFKEKPKYRKT